MGSFPLDDFPLCMACATPILPNQHPTHPCQRYSDHSCKWHDACFETYRRRKQDCPECHASLPHITKSSLSVKSRDVQFGIAIRNMSYMQDVGTRIPCFSYGNKMWSGFLLPGSILLVTRDCGMHLQYHLGVISVHRPGTHIVVIVDDQVYIAEYHVTPWHFIPMAASSCRDFLTRLHQPTELRSVFNKVNRF